MPIPPGIATPLSYDVRCSKGSEVTSENLRLRLRNGEVILGTFVFSSCPDSVESTASTGLDFLIIDTEHSPKDWATLAHLIRACELGGASPWVRVGANNRVEISRVLDLGAEGIVVPFVSSTTDVEEIVGHVRYPPAGHRGVCTVTRSSDYGLAEDFRHVVEEANKSVVIVGLIEDARGLQEFGLLRSMEPGLDALLIGRGDLASAFDSPGQARDEAVTAAVRDALTDAKGRDGCPVGIMVYAMDEIEMWIRLEASVIVYSVDRTLLNDSYSNLVSRHRREDGSRSRNRETSDDE